MTTYFNQLFDRRKYTTKFPSSQILKFGFKEFSKMSFAEYHKSRSFFFVYHFIDDEVIIFDEQYKKRFSSVWFAFYIYEAFVTAFHSIANNYTIRLYLTAFLCTKTYSQYIFEIGVFVTHVSCARVIYYLLKKDNAVDRKKFRWLYFLRLDNSKVLCKRHHFTKKNADRYLLNLSRIIMFVKMNDYLFAGACAWVFSRVVYLAFKEIPWIWVFLLSIPMGFLFEALAIVGYMHYNLHFTIFFATCMFTKNCMKSLSNLYPTNFLHQLPKEKLNSLAIRNIFQFNFMVKQFYYSQLNFNYTLNFCNGLITICFTYPWILFFTDLDILSFFFTLCLYSQGLLITMWLLIKIHTYFMDEIEKYSSFLHSLIHAVPSVRLKLKLENFFYIHQEHCPIRYKYMDLFYLTNEWYLHYILESFSIIFLLYQFNYS